MNNIWKQKKQDKAFQNVLSNIENIEKNKESIHKNIRSLKRWLRIQFLKIKSKISKRSRACDR